MLPAEVMAKTVYELRFPDISWETFKARCPALAQMRIKRQHAAIRALAAMEKNEAQLLAAYEAASISDAWHIQDGDHFWNAYRAALLKAAEEGEPE